MLVTIMILKKKHESFNRAPYRLKTALTMSQNLLQAISVKTNILGLWKYVCYIREIDITLTKYAKAIIWDPSYIH